MVYTAVQFVTILHTLNILDTGHLIGHNCLFLNPLHVVGLSALFSDVQGLIAQAPFITVPAFALCCMAICAVANIFGSLRFHK